MLRPYLGVLRMPRTRHFVAAGFVARLPISMVGLGLVLYVTDVKDSYALAGLLTAVYALSAAIITPFVGRIVDFAGQHRVLPWLAGTHVAALVAIVIAVPRTDSTVVLSLLAAVVGGSQPAIGAMVRARWAALLTGTQTLRTAFALESIIDEAIYVLGPPLATVAVVAVSPGAALILSAALVGIGSIALTVQRGTEPSPGPRIRSREPMAVGPLLLIGLVMLGLGIVFGALEIAVVSFSDDVGNRAWAGGLIASYAFGSMLSGIVLGARPVRMPLQIQWPLQCAFLTVATGTLPWIAAPIALTAVIFVAGLAVAPALITGFSLVEMVVPATRLTEALTWALSGLGLGLSGAAAVSGALVDIGGTYLAFLVSTGGAAVCLVVSGSAIRTFRRAAAPA